MRRGGVAMAWARFVCLVAVVLGVVSTQPQATLVRVALADSKELSARLQSIRVRVESAESDISNMKEEFNSLLAKKRELEYKERLQSSRRKRPFSSPPLKPLSNGPESNSERFKIV